MTQLAFASISLAQAPNSNALALFLDGADGVMKVKDIRGVVAPLSEFISGGGGGGGETTIPITCNVAGGVGGIADGETIPAGTDLTAFVTSLLVTIIPATLSIVISPSTALQQIQTIGTTTSSVSVTPTYSAGTDDAPTEYDVNLTINGVTTTPFTTITPTATTISVSKNAVSFVQIQGVVTNPQRVVNSNTRTFSFIFPYYSGRLTPTSGSTPPTTSQIATFIQTGSVSGFTGQLFNSATLGNVATNVAFSFSSSATAGFLFVAIPKSTINSSNSVISTPAKTSWFVTANPALTEAIGGGGGTLFPNVASTQSITNTGVWTGNFDIYISGYQTASDPLTFQN